MASTIELSTHGSQEEGKIFESQFPEVTEKELFEQVLPNLDDITGLITEYEGHQVLCSVPWSKENGKLRLQQNIVIVTVNEFANCLRKQDETLLAYIVRVDGSFFTIVVDKHLNSVYFIHSCSQTLSTLTKIHCDKLRTIFNEVQKFCSFEFSDIFCIEQSGQHSVAQAYINARVFMVGMIECQKRDEFGDFIRKVVTHPILCAENSYLLRVFKNPFKDFKENKQKVKQMIKKGISEGKSFDNVKKGIVDCGLGNNCTYKESFYVKTYYIKHCFNRFLGEIETHFQKCDDPSKLALALDKIRNFSDVKDEPFSNMKSYEIFKDCEMDMSDIKKQTFLEKLLKSCWEIVLNRCKMLVWENSFIEELLKCVRDSFKKNTDLFAMLGCSKGNQKHLDSSTVVLPFMLSHLTDDTQELPKSLNELRKAASNLHGKDSLSNRFLQNFNRVWGSIKCPAVIHFDTKEKKVRYQKGFVFLDKAIEEILEFLKEYDIKTLDNDDVKEKINEIKIFATELLMVNKSFHWRGSNVVIASKQIIIEEDGHHEWNVSGRSATSHTSSKAPSGTYSGDNGLAGEHGRHGESGGNILIIADSLVNSKDLTIKSNGGNDSDGQDGGDGKDGEDGKDGDGLDLENFKSKFPDPAVFTGWQAGKNLIKCFENVSKSLVQEWYDHYGHYCEMETSQGNLVKMALNHGGLGTYFLSFVSSNTLRQSYCIHYGTQGKRGQKGGDGGCKGDAGLGGYSGDVELKTLSGGSVDTHGRALSVHGQDGKDGKEGENGKGGKAGRNGKKARDNARLTEYISRPTQWYHGHLELKYYDNYESENYYARCPKTGKYARIVEVSPPTYALLHGSDGENTWTASGKEQSQQIQQRRQAPILSTAIVEEFWSEKGKDSSQYGIESPTIDAEHIKGMANDSLAVIAHKVCHIQRQNLILPRNQERNGFNSQKKLNIPALENVPKDEIADSHVDCLVKTQMHSTDAEIQEIINGCNENISSIQNWHKQLQRFLRVLESKKRKATHDDVMNYADILSILQSFITNLRYMKLERDTSIDLYNCIVTIRRQIEMQSNDRVLRGQLKSVFEFNS